MPGERDYRIQRRWHVGTVGAGIRLDREENFNEFVFQMMQAQSRASSGIGVDPRAQRKLTQALGQIGFGYYDAGIGHVGRCGQHPKKLHLPEAFLSTGAEL